MAVLKEGDIAPDGVRMVVDWDQMKPGCSILIPCVNVGLARRQVEKIFKKRSWSIRSQVVIENHILCLRIWRIS